MKNVLSVQMAIRLCVCLLLLVSCQKDVINSVQEDTGYLALAKRWYNADSNIAQKKKQDFDISKLSMDWNSCQFTTNSTGDSVIVIPIKSRTDTFYREIALVKNGENIPFGIIKEYQGNPFKSNTILNIYTGSGKLLETALYNFEKKTMQYIHFRNKGKGLLFWIKNKISCTGCSGSIDDGFSIEKIPVTGYPKNPGNGNNSGNNDCPPKLPSYPGTGSGGSGGSSGGGNNGGESGIMLYNRRIDTENLPICMSEVLSDIQGISGNTVADIIVNVFRKFTRL